MKTDVCGYDEGAVESETGRRITAEYGIEPGCLDVGRDDDGELRSFVSVSAVPELNPQNDSPCSDAPPRLFDPPASCLPQKISGLADPVTPTGTLGTAVQQWKHLACQIAGGRRRKTVMMATGGGLAILVFVLALIPPAGSPKSSAVPDVTTTSMAGSPAASAQPDLTDPLNASIELALSGAIAGLGNMQGVARSALRASIASRAGDIVLIDLAVTKPTGLTAFATVLLQKVGSQWRMRQIVDERN